MRIAMKWVGVVGLAIAFCAGCASSGDGKKDGGEQEVPHRFKRPAAVQASVKRVAGDNTIDKLSKETEDGKTVYEAEFKSERNGAFGQDRARPGRAWKRRWTFRPAETSRRHSRRGEHEVSGG